jgi:AraC family transcriptional activator of pyochelin receptor
MEVVFRNSAQEVLHKDKLLLHRDQLMDCSTWETVQEERKPFWELRFRQFYSDGIHIGFCNGDVHEELHVSTIEQGPMPGIAFLQQGDIVTTAHGEKKAQHFTSGQHNILLNAYTTETTVYRQQQDLKIFVLSFLPERFLALAENTGPVMEAMAEYIAGKNPSFHKDHQNLPLTPKMHMLIESMKDCTYRGGLRKLFLQSKALELLALQCAQLEERERLPARRVKLFPEDIRKVHLAREILLHDLQHAPSMSVLARQSGLNTFKLKAGFKQVFGNSVFGYLKDHRLEQAKNMIREGGKTVTEVAYETGYSTLQHFSNEFKKKYGLSPKGVKRG